MPKATALDNVIRKLARERADRLRSAYLANGMPAEELAAGEAELKAELAPMFKTWKPSMRMPKRGIQGAMLENRFKNLFETQESGGYNDFEGRRNLSSEYFGTRPNEEREKYGYLRRPRKYGRDDVENYGDFTVEFKPSVRKRMTVTNGDSYNNLLGNTVASIAAPGSPIVIDDPETYINWMGLSMSEADQDEELYNGRMMRKVIDDLKFYRRPTFGNDEYVEAQYHGPLTLKDVKSVTVPRWNGLDDWRPDMMHRSDRFGFPIYGYSGECLYNCR